MLVPSAEFSTAVAGVELGLSMVSAQTHFQQEVKTTTTTATGASLNKRFNEENNGCARAL